MSTRFDEVVVVEPLDHDPRAHRPDGAPGDAAEHRHRLLVTLGCQPDDELLKVTGELDPGRANGAIRRRRAQGSATGVAAA